MGSFDPKSFDDRYENAVADMVKAKLAGKPLKLREAPSQSGNVVSLMEALRESARSSDRSQSEPKGAAKKVTRASAPKAKVTKQPVIKKAG